MPQHQRCAESHHQPSKADCKVLQGSRSRQQACYKALQQTLSRFSHLASAELTREADAQTESALLTSASPPSQRSSTGNAAQQTPPWLSHLASAELTREADAPTLHRISRVDQQPPLPPLPSQALFQNSFSFTSDSQQPHSHSSPFEPSCIPITKSHHPMCSFP